MKSKELFKKGGKPKKIIIPVIIIVGILICVLAFFKVIKPGAGLSVRREKLVTLIPYRAGDKWGYCDWNKKLVIKPTYDDARPFEEGLAAVLLKNKWGS